MFIASNKIQNNINVFFNYLIVNIISVNTGLKLRQDRYHQL